MFGGLGSRRAVTAHAPRLVTGAIMHAVRQLRAVGAPQAVVKISRILRSLCEGAEQFRDGGNRALLSHSSASAALRKVVEKSRILRLLCGGGG